MLLLTWLALSARRRRRVALTTEALGIGDVLLLLVLAPLASVEHTLRILTAAALVGAIWGFSLRRSSAQPTPTIPFATVLLVTYAVAIGLGELTPLSPLLPWPN